MKKIAVVALGGNALLRSNEAGTIEQQEEHTLRTCEKLIGLLKLGYNLVITHGNGPQVGNILLRNEAGFNLYNIPKMPLDICVADSQGGIGYMIERQMRNALSKTNLRRNVLAIITQVLIDINDPAFQNPSKPIGRFYLKEEAELLSKTNGWIFKEDPARRGWRRVVPSPKPIDIMNKRVIKDMVKKGHIVIAVGGGGIPVYWHKDTRYLEAIEAVIDKDLASAFLAKEISADRFYIITDVPKVYLNYKKPNQLALDKITVEEAKRYYEMGEFPPGSMGPKILAAIEFIEGGGKEAIITNEEEIEKENCGTRIVLE
ncbi:MAG: carbamate kinase [Melioribacter sp.]|uniref:carbamate kinase n=1 Tax=Rosettibacter primus TaxID=3111523 RepID=UPI00247E81FC|nr:carbamate kinase [Melioribacter sp.]